MAPHAVPEEYSSPVNVFNASTAADFPSAQKLSKLQGDIAAKLDAYQNAQGEAEQSQALTQLSYAAQHFSNAAKPPLDAFIDLTHGPLANAALRSALAIGIFEGLDTEAYQTSDAVAQAIGAEPELAARLLRALAACDVIDAQEPQAGEKDGERVYRHSTLSKMYLDPEYRAWGIWVWDVIIHASKDIGAYFDKVGPKVPRTSMETPLCFARGMFGKSSFEVIENIGATKLMADGMTGSSRLCALDAIKLFDFGSLQPGDDGVVLVDIGGSRGEVLRLVQQRFPGLKGEGKCFVQDIPEVIEKGLVDGVDAGSGTFDFFNEAEPIKGAAAYYMQRIFHDWSDEDSKVILKNVRASMAPHSRLLISDDVVPDINPPASKALRDIKMMLVSGKERTEKNWRELLQSTGFEIVKIHGLHSPNNSIIEAKVAA